MNTIYANNSQVDELSTIPVPEYRIAFLEDNPDDVELMEHELNQANFKFTSIRIDKKREFIKHIIEFNPDVILADYSLTSFNGMQAFQMLKKINIAIPFILVTGVLSEQLALECLKDGIDDFVLKSSFKRLPTAITNAIEKKEAEREKNRIASELEKSHKELRLLLDHQQASLEEERVKIARDLHDELGQVLTALKIDIMMLWKKITSGKLLPDQVIHDEFTSITELVDKITRSVKEISSGLRPEALDELGILDAIRWQGVEFEKRNKISCKVFLPDDTLNLNKDLSIALFRIVQEALTNVARHSMATLVEIYLKTQKNLLALEIQDDGKGIREDVIRSSKSLGLIGLRERVHSLNGKFNIHAMRKGGTKVSVLIPFENNKLALA
ncbi:MAG TPA: sensor histidine kinase [Cyclobacteriaceae bacterium]|jgi:signal transduction histidine kinase|nr:sensor histidine kinase [Cyclobacteriaceae bacterium]